MTITADRARGSTAAGAPSGPTSLWEYIQGSGLGSLLLGLSKDPNAKLTVLLVSPEDGRPVLAIKAPTTDAAASAVEAEAAALSAVRALDVGPLAYTLPRLVDTIEFQGRLGVVMTAVHGTPMTTSYMGRGHTRSSARVSSDFAAAGEWLSAFHRATGGEAAALDMDGGVIGRLRRRFADDPRLADDAARLEEIHERLRHSSVPRTAVHGDFWLGNILLTHGRVSGVVDWEAGAGSGEPVRDLVRFALMYALYLDRRTGRGRRVRGHAGLRAGTSGAGIEYALDGAGWFPDLFRTFLGGGLAALGAPPERWRDASLAGIAEIAALTDEPDFARRHLDLFRRLTATPGAQRKVSG